MKWELSAGADFEFTSAVCSHGFFMLAPNRWDPASRTLRTVVALDDEHAADVVLSASPRGVRVEAPVRAADRAAITRAVSRMLRLDEDLAPFHVLCRASTTHAGAAEARFGRLLRSATLFEDVVKVICTCNIAWRQTTAIVRKLVEVWGVPAPSGARAFPTPRRLAEVSTQELRDVARLGYRAPFVHRLAHDVVSGALDLDVLETFAGSSSELHKALRRIHGIGDYAAGNLCMLLGRYDHLAVDTEMIRFLRERHPRRRFTPAAIRRYFARWAPWQFLAYWYELWSGYTAEHGDAREWSPEGVGARITESPKPAEAGSSMKRRI